MKNLERNEKYIASGFESSDDEDEDEDEEFEGEENPDTAFKEMQAKMKAFKDGKPAAG